MRQVSVFHNLEEEILAVKIYSPKLSRPDLLLGLARKYSIIFSRTNLPKSCVCLHPTDWLCLRCVCVSRFAFWPVI